MKEALDGVIVDAIDGSYCQGRPTLILAANAMPVSSQRHD